MFRGDADKVRAIMDDYRTAGLSARQVALLEFATRLTRSPQEMGRGEVEALRQAGLSDREILDVTLIVSHFNLVNRVTAALGAEVEPFRRSWHDHLFHGTPWDGTGQAPGVPGGIGG